MSAERSPAEQVMDLMNSTQWTIGEWCAHLTEDEMSTLRGGGRVEFWGFAGLDEERGGVSTCIVSAEVRAVGERLDPDLPQWKEMFPVDLDVSDDG